MEVFLVLHLMNPFTNQFVLDSIKVPNQETALMIKNKIETSPIYINADPRKKGWAEIVTREN